EGMETLKSSGAENRALENWSSVFVNVLNASVATGRINAWIDAAIGGLSVLSPLIILAFGGWLVLSGQISLGAMLAMNALAAGFLAPVSSLARTALQLQGLQSHVHRIDDMFQAAPEQSREQERAHRELEGGFTLQGVSFRYSAGT